MRVLKKYEDYNRSEVHDIFAPHTKFTPQAGTWGLQGIVKIPGTKDFIFYVTIGEKQGDYVFEEGITEDGILTWQSQPSQKLTNNTIKALINHNDSINNIYLFFRTEKTKNYTYLGKLAYVSHDYEREQPVHFKWQILDWDITTAVANRIGLELQSIDIPPIQQQEPIRKLVEFTPPDISNKNRVASTRVFKGHKVDFADSEYENKKLGSYGEKLVIDYEKQFLIDNGRPDLAEKVLHTAEIIGDGTGYDIESYELDGQKKYIEVKTTCGGSKTPFIMTINELEFSKAHAENYYMYRVYDYNKITCTGSFYQIKGYLQEHLIFDPIKFKVSKK